MPMISFREFKSRTHVQGGGPDFQDFLFDQSEELLDTTETRYDGAHYVIMATRGHASWLLV
jgi:hypothetical protein